MEHQKMNLPPGVLRVKTGYNPNSSSIGTVVYSLPYAFLAVSTLLALLPVLFKKKNDKNKETEPSDD